ncbi:MAG: flagellar biosynthetic protein FliR [Micrococcales bacterium]|nr:flagellar biosynthetic protein FliR [Micrococcales bacterium]
MDPIALTLPLGSLQTVMLASVRVAGFLVVAPPFSAKGMPGTVKVALSLAVGAGVAPRLAPLPEDSTGAFVGSLVMQAVIGLALGFGVQLVLTAVQVAGSFLDQFGGFMMGAAFDPLSQTQVSMMGRFYAYIATALLFATDGYQIVLQGLVRTFDALPLGVSLDPARLAEQLTDGMVGMFAGALQIAGPLVVVLFLTDIGLGLLTKVAPALNAFVMGFPLKILITLIMVGFALLVMDTVVRNLARDGVDLMGRVVGG